MILIRILIALLMTTTVNNEVVGENFKSVSEDGGAVHVAICTEFGEIKIELDAAGSSIPASNFLKYLDAGLYDDITFYRSIKRINMIGGGVAGKAMKEGSYKSMLRKVFPPEKLQSPTGNERILERGMIAYGHLGDGEFIQSEFILMVATEESLKYREEADGKRAGLIPFGRVVEGMAIVDKIYAMEVGGEENLPWGRGNILKNYVSIYSIERL